MVLQRTEAAVGRALVFFRAFALDTDVSLPRSVKRPELEKEMRSHVVGEATLMGKYSHHGTQGVQE